MLTSIMCMQAIDISNWLMLKSTRLATMGHYIKYKVDNSGVYTEFILA